MFKVNAVSRVRRWMQCCGLLLIVAAASAYPLSAQSRSHKQITAVQAYQLAMAALPPYAHRLRGVGAELPPLMKGGRFYLVSVTWDSHPDESVNVGGFAVDSWTGDVWNAASEGMEFHNPKLSRMQRKIRAKFGLSASAYRALHATQPLWLMSE